MKIYTNTFDLRQPSEKKFWVAPYSDFKIGIKVIGNKPIQYGKAIWLSDGKKNIDKDSEDNDFTYFKIKSGDTGEVNYTITVIDGPLTLGYFTLTQVVTNSTVYEQESGGEIPSDLEVDRITITGCGGGITLGCGYIQTPAMYADNITVMDNITIVENGSTKLQINSNKIVGDLVEFNDGCTGNGTIEMRSAYKSTGCGAPSMYFNGWYGIWNQTNEDYPFIEINDTDTDKKICFNLTNLVYTINDTSYGCGFSGNYSFRPTIAKDKNGNDIVVLAISQPT